MQDQNQEVPLYKCEFCGKENKTKFQNGRFCDMKCKNTFVCKENTGRKNKLKCVECGLEVEKGWTYKKRNFVCKSCIEKKRREEYEENPKKCKKCGNNISYKMRKGTFCSRSCANGRKHTEDSKKNISKGVSNWAKNNKEKKKEQSKKLIGKKHTEETKKRISSKLQIYPTDLLKLKRKLVTNETKCELCNESGIKANGKSFIEIHHIDGNNKNNNDNNLQFLCPNCHSKTSSFRNNKITKLNNEKLKEELKKCILSCVIDFSKKEWCEELYVYCKSCETLADAFRTPWSLRKRIKKLFPKFYYTKCYNENKNQENVVGMVRIELT